MNSCYWCGKWWTGPFCRSSHEGPRCLAIQQKSETNLTFTLRKKDKSRRRVRGQSKAEIRWYRYEEGDRGCRSYHGCCAGLCSCKNRRKTGRMYRRRSDSRFEPRANGRSAGIRQDLQRKGVREKAVIAEAQTFVFASRISGPGMVRIFRIKNAVLFLYFPQRITSPYFQSSARSCRVHAGKECSIH